MQSLQSVCVYCGSSSGIEPQFAAGGRRFGALLAEAGIGLVFGGGLRGIMGAVAEGCHEAGGHVTGIIPQFLIGKEAGDGDRKLLDEFIVVDTMHQRKQLLFERSDAFVGLPGGIGTLEEIVEIMTWAQLGRHDKPILLANLAGFWDPLLALFEHMSEAGFIHTRNRVAPLVASEVEDILPTLQARLGGG